MWNEKELFSLQHSINIKNYTAHPHDLMLMDRQTDGWTVGVAISPIPGPTAPAGDKKIQDCGACMNECVPTEFGRVRNLSGTTFNMPHEPVKDLNITVYRDINLLPTLRISWQILSKVLHFTYEQVSRTVEILLHWKIKLRNIFKTTVYKTHKTVLA